MKEKNTINNQKKKKSTIGKVKKSQQQEKKLGRENSVRGLQNKWVFFCGTIALRNLLGIFLLDLGQERVADLLGITQQHGIVGLVEHWVVNRSIAYVHAALDHWMVK